MVPEDDAAVAIVERVCVLAEISVVFDAVEARVVAFDAVEARVVVFVEVMEVQQVHRIVVHVGREDMVFVSNTFWAALAWQELVLRSQ